MEQTLIGAAGLLVAGAISPGPNNFVVMREAARAGWRGACRAIGGIVLGSLALLALASAGLGAALVAEPRLATAVAIVGGVYLAVLGVQLAGVRPLTMRPAARLAGARPLAARSAPALPAGVWGLFAFQFLNVKAWLLVLTVAAAAQASLGVAGALPMLAGFFVLVPAACLALWAWAGVALRRALRRPETRVVVDRVMGLLLVASSLLLILGG